MSGVAAVLKVLKSVSIMSDSNLSAILAKASAILAKASTILLRAVVKLSIIYAPSIGPYSVAS